MTYPSIKAVRTITYKRAKEALIMSGYTKVKKKDGEVLVYKDNTFCGRFFLHEGEVNVKTLSLFKMRAHKS